MPRYCRAEYELDDGTLVNVRLLDGPNEMLDGDQSEPQVYAKSQKSET